MIHNFINKNKYFNDENLKNVLHIVFSNYNSNTTTIDGLNTHIKTAVNTIYKDKDVNDLYEVLRNMKNTTVTTEELEDIGDIDNTLKSNNLNKDITENLSKNAKKTLEDKVSSLKKEETDDTTIIPFSTVPVTADTSEMKTDFTYKAKKTLEDKVTSLLEKGETDDTTIIPLSTVPVNVNTNKMKTALTDKAKEILETKIKEALNKPAITGTAQSVVDTTVMKTALTDTAKNMFRQRLAAAFNKLKKKSVKIQSDKDDSTTKYQPNKLNKIDYLTLQLTRQVNTQIKARESTLVENFYQEYFNEIRICKQIRRKKFGIQNPGNQCYSNAFFQMLYSMPAMRQIFTGSEINDENDTIGLLVKRFKYIRDSISDTNYVISQDIDKQRPPTESTCLVKYFPDYKSQHDPAEIFNFIDDAIELRIYKYVLECYGKNIDRINSLTELRTTEFKEVEQIINKEWVKIQTSQNKLTGVYNLYVKFIQDTITNQEKDILFNNKEPPQYIFGLKHFINSITHNQITHFVCEENKQIVQSVTTNDKIIQLPLKHNTDNNKEYCKSIQESINAFQEIEQLDTSEWSRTDSCNGTFSEKYIDDNNEKVKTYNVKKQFKHLKTLEENKYIIIQLKRFSFADGRSKKDTTEIIVDKEITISKYDKFNVEKQLNEAINKVIDINNISNEEKDILYTDIGNIMSNMHQIPITYQSQNGGDFFIPYLDEKKTFIDDSYTYINTPNEDKYRLTGVICHSEGTSINSGHYFYYEYDHNGDIQYCYEDNNVNELQDGEFVEAKEEKAKEENLSNLTEDQQVEIAINNSKKTQDKVNVSYYTNKKAAEEHIKKNGYIFLYSRYTVNQYNPEETEKEIIEQEKELKLSSEDYKDNDNMLIETEKKMTVAQLNEEVRYVSNTINELNEQIINAETNNKLERKLNESKTSLLNRLKRLKKLIKEKLEKETREKLREEADALLQKQLDERVRLAIKEGTNLLKNLQPVTSAKKKQDEEAFLKKKQEEEAASVLAKKKQEEDKKKQEEEADALAKKKQE